MSVSGFLIIIFAIILGIWDAIAVACWGVTASESWFINRVARRYPSFVFVAGVLIGHFFCGMSP